MKSVSTTGISLKLLVVFLLFVTQFQITKAQSAGLSIKGTISVLGSGEKVAGASVLLQNSEVSLQEVSDAKGGYRFNDVPQGTYTVSTKAFGYINHECHLKLTKDTVLEVTLNVDYRQLQEVFITASESKGLTSSSLIDRKAMQHLQPSSFTDLLELLPGGRATDPNLTGMNQIRLREVGTTSSNYDISSLGTAFYIDGAPINTTANIQTGSGYLSTDPNSSRDATNKGVDMRSIPTDDIERIEIIRGIPSVEYGDLTSGLIKIERKKGNTPLTARIKSDGFSKLFSIGKGFAAKDSSFTLNTDLGLINAKADPRNNYENFKRLNASVRTEKKWRLPNNLLTWSSAFDYGTTIDNQKTDPDNAYQLTDTYRSQYQSFGLSNTVSLRSRRPALLRSLDIYSKIGYQYDLLEVDKLIQARTATILANSLIAGSHEASYLTPTYVSNLTVEGKPLNVFLKATALLGFSTGMLKHGIKVGAESSFSKNYGYGQYYDLNYPTSIVDFTARPRAFSDIPSMHNLSFFAEDHMHFNLGRHHVEAAVGLRSMAVLNMDNQYKLANKLHWDPRINAQWSLPAMEAFGEPLKIRVGGGYGLHTKLPTSDHLYPNKQYRDLVELNFYHNNPAYRLVYVYTHIVDPTNFGLKAAVNAKWEVNTDISLGENRLSLTYFKENMTSGFRNASRYHPISYNKYDNTSLDNAANLPGKPAIEHFSYQEQKEYYAYTITSNGSSLLKEGIEFQFTSKRLPSINTRFTVNGAWFNSSYLSSQPIYQVIPPSAITNNQIRQYVGRYNDDTGYLLQQLNTNLTIDSYLPRYGLTLSSSIQNIWFSSRQEAWKSGTPTSYSDINGIEHAYTEADKNHPDLQWLNRIYHDSQFTKHVVPINLQVNFKASKQFRNKIRASMFVNRLFTFYPDYKHNGITIFREDFNGPYFGMEINLTF